MTSILSFCILALCIATICTPEQMHSYLVCIGRQEFFRSSLMDICSQSCYKRVLFRYNHTDFYGNQQHGVEFTGPLWDPVRVFWNLTSFSMFLVVPAFYCAIFKFRKAQDLTPG